MVKHGSPLARGFVAAARRAVACAALLAVVLTPVGLEAEQPPRVVRVGVYQNKPKVFTDETGRASGLFIELLAEIAKVEGWTLSPVPCQWSDCLAALDAGKLDLMPDVAYSRERSQRFAFHKTPVLESWSQLYAHPDASIHVLSDVKGKRVAVLADSIQQATFQQMTNGFGLEVRFVPTKSLEDAFRAVQAGDADAAIANHLFGGYFHRQYGLERTSVVFQVAELYFVTAPAKNPELLVAVDRHLDAWRREPSSVYYHVLDHWMDRPPVSVVPERVRWIIGVTVSLLLLAVAWVLLLRARVRARTRHLSRVNAELRRTEAVLNSAQRLSRTGGWEWDVDKQVATWTEESYRLHGYSPDELEPGSADHLEKSFACYDAEVRDSVREAFRRCVEEGEPYDLEVPFTSKTGQKLWVRTTAEPIRDGDGQVVKVVGNIMDVSQRKHDEAQRARLEEELRQTQKLEAIGALAGSVAHDFNNLLAVIRSSGDMALLEANGQEGAALREHLKEIVSAGRRGEALTRQLLAFGRKQDLKLEPVSVNQVTTELEPMLRRVVDSGVELGVSLAPEVSRTLADTGQLEQILMNLVLNARDAMPDGGKLTISTADVVLGEADAARPPHVEPGHYVVLAVSDTGTGMDPETRARIFEPFFTTKEVGKGTGLGLSSVYGIVRQSRGHIDVDTEPGRGTTFRIYLQAEPVDGAPKATIAPIQPSQPEVPVTSGGHLD